MPKSTAASLLSVVSTTRMLPSVLERYPSFVAVNTYCCCEAPVASVTPPAGFCVALAGTPVRANAPFWFVVVVWFPRAIVTPDNGSPFVSVTYPKICPLAE